MAKKLPRFGYVFTKSERYAIYFDGLLCGYMRWPRDAYEWIDTLVVGVYGAGDPRRFEISDNYLTAKMSVYHQNRRAKRHAYPGQLRTEEWIELICYFGGACLGCGNNKKIPVPDHVIPLHSGGPNIIANLQPLCRSCNSRKRINWVDYRDQNMLSRFLLRYRKQE